MPEERKPRSGGNEEQKGAERPDVGKQEAEDAPAPPRPEAQPDGDPGPGKPC